MNELVTLATSKEAVAVYALVLAGIEKKFQFIKPIVKFAESHKGVAKEVEQLAVNGLGELVHSPHVAELELKAKRIEEDLQDNQLVQLAGQVLHAAGKRLDNLTPNQKTGLALVVSTEAKKLGLDVTQSAISDALNVADKAVDVIGALPLFQSTKQIDEPVQSQNPAPADNGQPSTPAAS